MSPNIKEFISGLPKCELHVHLEGTLEPVLARSLAERNGMPIPADIGTGSDNDGYPFHDLPSFLKVYYAAMSCLQTVEDFSDLVYSYLAKANSQNLVHAEMFFDPQGHTSRGIAFETIMTGLAHGIERAKKEYGVSTGLIMCFLRDHSAESAMQTLDTLLESPHRSDVVGIGLDSDEAGNPPIKFADVYAKAKQAGLRLTMHCDVDQVNSIEHIRQALHDIGVERLDHGTNIVEDPVLVAEIRDKGIGLTCCPISNSIVCSDFKGKEMKSLLGQGVKVTINSDDPAYFRGYMTENLEKVLEAGLSLEDLVKTQRNALEISWISDDERIGLMGKLNEYVKAQGI
jgi:adenine deaminase